MTNELETHMNWDLSSYFPQFDGPEMRQFRDALHRDLAAVQEEAAPLAPLNAVNAAEWEKVFLRSEDLVRRLSHLESYIGCLCAADSRNEAYQKAEAEMARMGAEFEKLEVELFRALKGVEEEVFSAFVSREAFEGMRYYIERLRQRAAWTMSREQERLAAELGVDGLNAWGRLYDTLSGRLEFDMEYPDGRRARVPMSQRRSLLENVERSVRRAAFEGGNAAWATVEDVAAAALNGIAGTRLTLNRHRGVNHFLEVALFQSAITQECLDAMFEAIQANLALPRRMLRLKAGALGLDRMAWYDLAAPLPLAQQEKIPWERGKALVRDSFARAYPALADYVQTMFDRRWIEWEPRAGKRPGGFCTGSLLTKESRIFMTYQDTLGAVMTLAHEAGHAFHHEILRDARPYANVYPMTLAESASTFGEMLLIEGVLQDENTSDAQKALMLDSELNEAVAFLLDIPVRYEFEKAFHEERTGGEVSVSRLKELMIATQRRIFGEDLEPGGEDPYFWASKLHFYITGVTFYNFPYTFGYLLSRGLYALFKKEGAEFLPRYEAFLRLTGSDTAVGVARRSLGRDLESPEFWAESIRSLQEPLERLETLLPSVLPQA